MFFRGDYLWTCCRDEVLKYFAKVCEDIARDVDLIARVGGEEFVIILPETNINGAYNFSERLRKKVFGSSLTIENESINFSVSIGIAEFDPEADKDTKTILQKADKALYDAKHSGRNSSVIYQKATEV